MRSTDSPSIARRWTTCFFGASCGAGFAALSLASFDAVRFELPLLLVLGLLTPMEFLVAVAASIWVPLIHCSPHLPTLRELLDSPHARFRVLLSSPAILLGWWALGLLSLRLFVAFDDRPVFGGLLLSLTALGCLVMVARGVDEAARRLARRIRPPGSAATVIVSVLLLLCGVTGLTLVGNTAGVGSPWALFGVFRRPELDLGPVLSLTVLAVLAYVGALLAAGPRWGRYWAWLGLLTFAVQLFALSLAARMSFSDSVAVQRRKGLAAVSLGGLQRLADRDGDGVAAAFGGGDCNDHDARVAPGQPDLPDNGIDEDCSGADRVSAVEQPPEPTEQQPAAAQALPERPNFLLLSVDTLRFDLGYTGRDRVRNLSPRLDALARESTVFERAYALASYTSKSLGPTLIGRYPSETHRSFEHFDRFSAEIPFVQERLSNAGIRTVSVQGYWYFFFKGYGFERGWDVLDSEAAPRVVAIEGDRSKNGDKLADRAIAQLEQLASGQGQFFAWVHWVDPHAEYVPHEDFDFGADSRARYDGEVAFVDAQIGRVLDALSRLNLTERTIILVSSDHGEAFSEHGMIRHGFEVWEELVRVPLILHVPGALPRQVGVRRSLIDVAPTILETFGVQVAGGDDFIRGTSLYRDALAEPDVLPSERAVLVDMPQGPHNQQRRAFYHGDFKLITSSGRAIGLYDLKKDPAERKDLSKEQELVAKQLAAQEAFLAGLKEIPARR